MLEKNDSDFKLRFLNLPSKRRSYNGVFFMFADVWVTLRFFILHLLRFLGYTNVFEFATQNARNRSFKVTFKFLNLARKSRFHYVELRIWNLSPKMRSYYF